MLEVKIQAKGRRYVAPADLREILGAERAREKLADAIEALVAQLDMMDGDPDLEDDTSDFELSGDEMGDPAYAEWHTLRGTQKKGQLLATQNEDDEEDDAPEEDDASGQCDEDGINTANGGLRRQGPGCEISDPGGDSDGEALPAYADHDQREPLPWSSANDLRAWRPHRDRIRRTSCTKEIRIYRGVKLADYALRDSRVSIGVANDLI